MHQNWLSVPTEFIDGMLSIYEPQYRLLTSARYTNGKIEGIFSEYVYPFTPKRLFEYLNATMAVFMIGQLLYVFVGQYIKSGHSSTLQSFTIDDFKSLRDSTHAYITGINIKFTRPVSLRNGISIHMELLSEKRTKNIVTATMAVNIEERISGTVDTALVFARTAAI